jgi:hypothetical protein
MPSIILKSGESFEQHFLLERAYRFDQPGAYEVEFLTVLTTLVGEQSGPFADKALIRIPVTRREKFTMAR